MHHAAWRFVERTAAQIGPVDAVLEIGSRNINGSVRGLFEYDRYLGVDLHAGPGVDLVADGATVEPPHPVDLVVCCEVLEHTDQAEAIVAHALDMLPSGGHLVVTCAGPNRPPHSATDGGALRPGEYYRNPTIAELGQWVTAHGGQIREAIDAPRPCDLYLWAVKA